MSCSDACLKSHVAATFELRSAAPVLSCCWHTFCKPDCVPQVLCSTTDQPHFHSALENHRSPEAFKINLKGKRKVISESYFRWEKNNSIILLFFCPFGSMTLCFLHCTFAFWRWYTANTCNDGEDSDVHDVHLCINPMFQALYIPHVWSPRSCSHFIEKLNDLLNTKAILWQRKDPSPGWPHFKSQAYPSTLFPSAFLSYLPSFFLLFFPVSLFSFPSFPFPFF